jgi:hypothetical protein
MTVNLESQYEGLSTREGFNISLRHFQFVSGLMGDFESNINLADIVNEGIGEKTVQPVQIRPIANALLVDRYRYHYASYNMKDNIEDFTSIIDEIQRWTSVDLVLAYYSPELGLTLINPKNPEHWKAIRVLKKNELVTIYCGAFGGKSQKKLFSDAIDRLIDLFEGKKFKTPTAFEGGRFRYVPKKPPVRTKRAASQRKSRARKAAPARAEPSQSVSAQPAPAPTAALQPPPEPPPAAATRMTPLYGITVTNELFHNGNVEAWKKIIESYETYHPGLKVFVFYDGERINDLNTLFKWGKVKRGTAIMIAVAGDNIKDVAKLQKYLRQGASHLFEAFLKGAPNKILQLF